MMDFITIPLVVGMITLGIYKLFELFARRRERMALIEKLGEKLTPTLLDLPFQIPAFKSSSKPFGTLKIAALLLGVGLGLLVGFFICQYAFGPNGMMGRTDGMGQYNNTWEFTGLIIGASTLLFGGLGLLIAFVIELKLDKKKDD